jgi:hypothetical protein
MPLKYDPELQKEIGILLKNTVVKDRAGSRAQFIRILLILSVVLVFVEVVGLETGTKLSVVITSCILAVMWTAWDMVMVLHGFYCNDNRQFRMKLGKTTW